MVCDLIMFGLFKRKTFNKDHFPKIVNDLVDKMDSTQEIIIASIHSQLEFYLCHLELYKFSLCPHKNFMRT